MKQHNHNVLLFCLYLYVCACVVRVGVHTSECEKACRSMRTCVCLCVKVWSLLESLVGEDSLALLPGAQVVTYVHVRLK